MSYAILKSNIYLNECFVKLQPSYIFVPGKNIATENVKGKPTKSKALQNRDRLSNKPPGAASGNHNYVNVEPGTNIPPTVNI